MFAILTFIFGWLFGGQLIDILTGLLPVTT